MARFVKLKREGDGGDLYVNPEHVVAIAEGDGCTLLGLVNDMENEAVPVLGDVHVIAKLLEGP